MIKNADLGAQLVENARLALAHARGEYDPPKVQWVPRPAIGGEVAAATALGAEEGSR